MDNSPPFDVEQALARALKLKPPGNPVAPESDQGRKVVVVHSVEALTAALASALPATTILVADGHYLIAEELLLATPNVVLRSASGVREKVVLDGMGRFGRILTLKGASDVLIADLTFANCERYGLLLLGDSQCHNVSIHNCLFHNIWTRGVKGTHPARPGDNATAPLYPPSVVHQVRPVGGAIRHCLFYNDSIKPMNDLFGGDYISGIDMMGLKDWTIADNIFLNIRGKTGGGRGAIFIWMEAESVVAERNLIIACDRGICYGNPSSKVVNMFGGIVRNNFIVGGAGMAIEIDECCNTAVLHNSIYATNFNYARTLNFARLSAGNRCFNNLVHGREGCIVLPEGIPHGGNLQGDLTPYFRDGPAGDLHLTDQATPAFAAAIGAAEVQDDFDRRPRKPKADIGAAECM